MIHSLKDENLFNESVCKSLTEFNTRIKPQILSLWPDAQRIIDFVVNGTDSGVTYQELAKFVDKFGSRLTGTQNLENSIDYMTELLKREHHLNVHEEEVTVPTWVIKKHLIMNSVIFVKLRPEAENGLKWLSQNQTVKHFGSG